MTSIEEEAEERKLEVGNQGQLVLNQDMDQNTKFVYRYLTTNIPATHLREPLGMMNCLH